MKHNFQIRAGDTLKITGTRVVQDQVLLIQAREVINRQQRLQLRDQKGRPLWPAAGERII